MPADVGFAPRQSLVFEAILSQWVSPRLTITCPTLFRDLLRRPTPSSPKLRSHREHPTPAHALTRRRTRRTSRSHPYSPCANEACMPRDSRYPPAALTALAPSNVPRAY